jgi:AP-2 complex subunit alpha
MAYRGLNVFIADLRNAQNDKAAEQRRIDKEMANIRAKFTSGKRLESYSRKKYVWKMIYMFMLGYEVDFGHMEMINCLSASKYAEKHVGYVGISLLLKNTDDMMTLVINTIRQDLKSNSDAVQSLALAGTANIGGTQLTEAVAADVQRVLLSPATRDVVRKKAALTLLRLYRIDETVIDLEESAGPLIGLLEQKNIGVRIAVVSLLLNMVSSSTQYLEDCVPRCIMCLTQLVIHKACPSDYLYYNTACPWLQVKLLRMLQYFPLPTDSTLVGRLNEVLERILTRTEVTKSVNKNNSDHSILFEAINLIIHQEYRSDEKLRSKAVELLGKYIAVREPNIRYLGLSSMSKLAKFANDTDIDQHKSRILFSLKDGDISIRRRALELMFAMCNANNSEDVVEELLQHLVIAEYDIKEEMVLKIAILAERFAKNLNWYIDTVLQMIRVAGAYISKEIWHRVVQIVTNNEDIQLYATQQIYETIIPPGADETLICLGAYVLGEFGYLLADKEVNPVSGLEQFNVIHAHFSKQLMPLTQALMLSSYVKMVSLHDDDVRNTILPIFKEMGGHIDMEVQQRAVEYLALPSLNKPELIEHVLESMPHYAEDRASVLEAILDAKKQGQEDKDAEKHDGASIKRKSRKKKAITNKRDDGSDDSGSEDSASDSVSDESGSDNSEDEDILGLETTTKEGRGNSDSNNSNGGDDDLLGLSMNGNTNNDMNGGGGGDDLLGDFGGSSEPKTIPKEMMGKVMKCFRDACVCPKSILYEDNEIQVGIQQQYQGAMGRVMLFIGNKNQSSPFTNFKINVQSVNYLSWGKDKQPPTTKPGESVNPKSQYKFSMQFMVMRPFVNPPQVKITMNLNGQNYEYLLRLPIVATRFFEGTNIEASVFKQRWMQISQEKQTVQIFPAKGQIAMDKIRALLSGGCRLAIIQGLDNQNSISCCGVFRTGQKTPTGNPVSVGCMMRLECNPQSLKYRITVKALHDDVGVALKNIVTNQLADRDLVNGGGVKAYDNGPSGF